MAAQDYDMAKPEMDGEISHVEAIAVADSHKMTVKQYLSTRLSSLKPDMASAKVENPFVVLRLLTRENWHFFFVAWFAWIWDAFDFFTVSVTVTALAASFDVTTKDVTWGITLVLMLRTVGSIIFGLWADRYGRKWPFIVNNVLFIVLELGTGFAQNYKQFLACRALFGIAMGGLYGNAVATATEDVPERARGVISGILQIGYPLGYLLATAFGRALVNTTSHGWRPLFWFGACPPVLIILYRLWLPETQMFRQREVVRKSTKSATATFFAEAKLSLKHHWLIFCYLVAFMAALQFMSHGVQDFYPTLLVSTYGFSPDQMTIAQCTANLGSICGGITAGHISNKIGRRLTILICCVGGCALLYPFTFTSTMAVCAPAFFMNFFVQGTYGVLPAHLMELSPGALRSFVIGTSYQLGNLASSGSSTIQAAIGENYPLPPGPKGVKRYDYGRVICIFCGVAFFFVVVLTILGPEKRGRTMDTLEEEEIQLAAHKTAGELKDVVAKEQV